VEPKESPLEALDYLAKKETCVDLLLTDVIMPAMAGIELRDRAIRIRPDLKVLFVSGYTANIVVQQGVLERDGHFLQKPFSIQELARKLSEVLQN
jgi:YesN/AraC family two-component response regulator